MAAAMLDRSACRANCPSFLPAAMAVAGCKGQAARCTGASAADCGTATVFPSSTSPVPAAAAARRTSAAAKRSPWGWGVTMPTR